MRKGTKWNNQKHIRQNLCSDSQSPPQSTGKVLVGHSWLPLMGFFHCGPRVTNPKRRLSTFCFVCHHSAWAPSQPHPLMKMQRVGLAGQARHSGEALAQKSVACVLFSSPGFCKGSILSAEGEANLSLGSHPQGWCSLSQLQSSWRPSLAVTHPPVWAEQTPRAGIPSSTQGHAGCLRQGFRRQRWIILLRTMT